MTTSYISCERILPSQNIFRQLTITWYDKVIEFTTGSTHILLNIFDFSYMYMPDTVQLKILIYLASLNII